MLNWSIYAILIGLLWCHLAYIINPLQMLGILHDTLQQNDCTSSSFPVILWPWVKIKVIQTEELYCKVKMCLASHLSWNKSVHTCPDAGQSQRHILYNHIQSSLRWIVFLQSKFSMSFKNVQVVAPHYIWSKSIEKYARKWVHKFLISHTAVTLQDKGIQTLIKVYSSVVSITIPSLKEIGP